MIRMAPPSSKPYSSQKSILLEQAMSSVKLTSLIFNRLRRFLAVETRPIRVFSMCNSIMPSSAERNTNLLMFLVLIFIVYNAYYTAFFQKVKHYFHLFGLMKSMTYKSLSIFLIYTVIIHTFGQMSSIFFPYINQALTTELSH